MKVLRLQPGAEMAGVTEEIARLLGEGKTVEVTVAETGEVVSPQVAAERLGFSRQHVMRLIENGSLQAEQMPGSSYWRIPVSALAELERRRAEARQIADEWSRDLDAMGAPVE